MSWVTQATDNFNRANETPLGNGVWTVLPFTTSLSITSNVVVPTNPISDCGARYTGRAWADDQSSSAILTATAGGVGEGPGLCVRCASGALTYYRFVINTSVGSAEFRRFIAGVSAQLDTFATVLTNGDRWTFRATGPASAVTLEALQNGVSRRTFVDNSSLQSGSPGLAYSSNNTGSIMDDWEGGEFVADTILKVNYSRFPKPRLAYAG